MKSKTPSPFAWGCGLGLGLIAAAIFAFVVLPVAGVAVIGGGSIFHRAAMRAANAEQAARDADEARAASNRATANLMGAIASGDVPAARAALAAGARIEATDADGKTPLRQACERDDYQMVAALIQAGARVDSAAADGRTPLFVARVRQDWDIAKLLVQHGAK